MKTTRWIRAACTALVATSLGHGWAHAQTTDGYHAVQVFPVVVDTASFAQRFSFRNPNAANITLEPRYFPASGTTAVPITCPGVLVPAGATATVTSLRALCPALPAGSQFGFLHLQETSPNVAHFAAFSRIANPQGNGFTVEAFAASEFTSAVSVVNGIRRLAAQSGAPAYQTNCFIGAINELAPVGATSSLVVRYTLYSNIGVQLAAAEVVLEPGKMFRVLDVFAVAPVGNYDDARVRFEVVSGDDAGILAFCTVQDNTSFGADFRVAKQELGKAGRGLPANAATIGPQDLTALRETDVGYDSFVDFVLPTGSFYQQHIVYFRVPDVVQCELLETLSGLRPGTLYGLEMRLLDITGQVVAGANEGTHFDKKYLGDKVDTGGNNQAYVIHVESNENILGSINPVKAYRLHCRSGSGHTIGELVKKSSGNLY